MNRGAVVLLVLCSVSVGTPAGGQSTTDVFKDFKAAIKAQDRRNWKGSVDLLRKSLATRPENGQAVRLYGSRYRSYLPHFYLGLAFYKQDDCAGALREWDLCRQAGAVQTTVEYDSLLTYQVECRARLSRGAPAAGAGTAPL
jgi:hypothetical protein